MCIPTIPKKIWLPLCAVLFLVAIPAAWALPPRVSWQPDHLDFGSLTPGISATYSVMLTETGILPIVATNQLRIVPDGAVAPYITVTPPVFPSVFKRGDQVQVQLRVSIPSAMMGGVVTGRLLLQREFPAGKVIDVFRAEALPIQLTIAPQPEVTWAPNAIAETLLAGTQKVIPVVLTAKGNIAAAAITVSPSLQSLVTVAPTTIANMKTGDTVGVTITLAPAATLAPGTVQGTVNARISTATIVQPLPITVTVPAVNTAPIANAGPNQTIPVGSSVTLDGSASKDPDGNALSYAWSLKSLPAGSTARLSSVTTVNPSFVPDMPGIYVVQLVVNDGTVNSTPSETQITAVANDWPIFSDATSGITFPYATFGHPGTISLRHEDGGLISAYMYSTEGTPINQYAFWFSANDEHLTLADWFGKYIDIDGVLLSSGAFTQKTLSNGMKVYVHTGVIPAETAEAIGPTSYVYGMSASGNTIIEAAISQVNTLEQLGVSYETADEALLVMLENMSVP